MTLPNSFGKVNRKVYTFFQETEGNRNQIFVQKNEQELYKKEAERSVPNKMALTKINDLSFDWTDFQVLSFETDTVDGAEIVRTKEIFQTWEITVNGLRFEQLSALRHNFVVRFGTGEPLLASQIADDTTYWWVKHILSEGLDNSNNNTYTIYYGLYIADSSGLEEVDDNGMQVRLQLTLFNPTYTR